MNEGERVSPIEKSTHWSAVLAGIIGKGFRVLAPAYLVFILTSDIHAPTNSDIITIGVTAEESVFYQPRDQQPKDESLIVLRQEYELLERFKENGASLEGRGMVDYGVGYQIVRLPSDKSDESLYFLRLHMAGYSTEGTHVSQFNRQTFNYTEADLPQGLLVHIAATADLSDFPERIADQNSYFDEQNAEYFWLRTDRGPVVINHDTTFAPWHTQKGVTVQPVQRIHQTDNGGISLSGENFHYDLKAEKKP